MITEEFHTSVYRDLFFKWIVLNKKQYIQDQFHCIVEESNEIDDIIIFDSEQVKGKITLWYNHIVEEEIYRKSDQKLLFYLHYTIIDLSQCTHLFHEFYDILLKHRTQKEIRIALCCSGGLSTSVFVDEMKEICQLENVYFQLDSLSLHQVYQKYADYDALYLAPQIAHLEPDLITYTKHSIPIHCIDATLFAIKDYHHIVKIIQENIIKDGENYGY